MNFYIIEQLIAHDPATNISFLEEFISNYNLPEIFIKI